MPVYLHKNKSQKIISAIKNGLIYNKKLSKNITL